MKVIEVGNRRITEVEARSLLSELLTKLDPESGKALELQRIAEMVEEAKARIPKPGQIAGLSTGYPSIDELTMGLDKGEVSVWYGGTSMGKSQITQNIALNMAEAGTPIMMVPLEMGVYLNTSRLLYMYGEHKEESFRKLPIYYPKSNRVDLESLANTVADGVANYGIRVVIVDQLQQLVPRRGANLVEAISATTDELHKIADENQVHVMLISHINRTGDRSHAPGLEELKGSGSIEQDADLCIALWRDFEEDDEDFRSPLTVVLRKNRNRGGAIGRGIQLAFQSNMRLVERITTNSSLGL